MPSAIEGRHRDHVESRIATIWEDVLGIGVVMPDDDYFDLGGDSVRALLCCSRINASFGTSLDLTDFFESPTPARLARVLRAGSTVAKESGVVPIADVDAGGAPLFFVHAATGEVMFLRNIRAGTFDRTVYGIRSPGFDPSRRLPDTIEEMAAAYVSEVLRVCPAGPFLLAGYSAGAVIAFEMAVQLRSRGIPPSYLGLVDPPIPGPDPDFAGTVAELKRQRAAFLVDLYDVPDSWVHTEGAAMVLRDAGAIPPDWSTSYFDRTLEVWAVNSLAVTRYTAGGAYDGPAYLYIGRDVAQAPTGSKPTSLRDNPVRDPCSAYWSAHLAPESVLRRVVANHLDIMRHPSLYPWMRSDIEQSMPRQPVTQERSA